MALEGLLASHWDRLAPSAEDWDDAAWLDGFVWVPSDPTPADAVRTRRSHIARDITDEDMAAVGALG